jgi:3-oxoacyl-[acyl-carrier protein] reductase
MARSLDGKTAIVTGASRGIGRACAIELARDGANVALAARSRDDLAATAAAIAALGGRAHVQVADLREAGAAGALVDAAIGAFGALDLVVNNAGATKRGPFASLTDEDFHDGFALKFHGYVRLARASWPHLTKRKGAIVNIVGVGGRMASADFTIGGSVNAALLNFTRALAQQGGREGVRVVAINPGSIMTDRLKGRIATAMRESGQDEAAVIAAMLAQHGVARFGEPAEIGRAVVWLAGPDAAYVNGALIDVDGGLTRGL